jgi:hypothetical protein
MTDPLADLPFSKAKQTGNSPGRNRWCLETGELKSECACRSCINSRNRLGGLKAQRRDGKQLAKALGKRPGRINNEDTTTWPIRWEAKSGKLAEGVRRFYAATKAQADAATPIGSGYPFVAIADGLCVLRTEDFQRLLNEARRGVL